MRYVLSDNTVRRLGEMSRQLDSLVPRNVPAASRPSFENPGATPYNFAVVSYYQSGGWWAEVCNGKPWDLVGASGAGEIRIQQLNGSVLVVTALPKAFALVSGDRIYARIWYATNGGSGSSGSLEQMSGSWPVLVSGLSSGTLINWPLALVNSGTGEVTQKHVGDITIPILSTGGVSPVKITGGSGQNHSGYVYANGIDLIASGAPVRIKILQIAPEAVIPNGTYLPAWPLSWVSGSGRVTYWTADVPRWL